jgi:hypothetical protein
MGPAAAPAVTTGDPPVVVVVDWRAPVPEAAPLLVMMLVARVVVVVTATVVLDSASASDDPVSTGAGPSQCQWSPCGTQPIDSVGLGAREPVPGLSVVVCSSGCSLVAEVTAGGGEDSTAPAVVERAPSQCLLRKGQHWLLIDGRCTMGDRRALLAGIVTLRELYQWSS